MFTPTSLAGRVYFTWFSFVVLLLQAAYTATLAAFFTRSQTPVQAITSMASFAQNKVPACVPNDAFVMGLLQEHFPGTSYVTVPQGDVPGLLASVTNGTCAGAVLTDVQSNFFLGPGDPNARFCALEVVGTPLSMGQYAIAFSPRWNSTVAPAALNCAAMYSAAWSRCSVCSQSRGYRAMHSMST